MLVNDDPAPLALRQSDLLDQVVTVIRGTVVLIERHQRLTVSGHFHLGRFDTQFDIFSDPQQAATAFFPCGMRITTSGYNISGLGGDIGIGVALQPRI